MDDKLKALEKYNFCGGNTPTLGVIHTYYTGKIYAYKGNRLVKVLVGQQWRAGKNCGLPRLHHLAVQRRHQACSGMEIK